MNETNTLLSEHPYDLLLVGHTHTFDRRGKELIIGNGGAPLQGDSGHGWATIEKLAMGGFRVTQYRADTGQAVDQFTVE